MSEEQENEALFNHMGKKCTLNNLDPDLKKLFDMCGISEDQLKDKETSKVIYDFIEEKGGVEAVKDELQRQGPSGPSGPSGLVLPMATVDIKNPEINTRYHSNSQMNNINLHSNFKKKDKGKNKKISKAEIGTPSNFRHVGHVGWDPNIGFDLNNMDPDLKKLFDMCGISEDQLKDKETSKVIYDFIEEKGGVEAAKDELRRQAPPTPKGGPPPPPPIHSSGPPVYNPDTCQIGLNFASEEDAKVFKAAANDPLGKRLRKTEKRREPSNGPSGPSGPSGLVLPMATVDIKNPEINTRYHSNSQMNNLHSNFKKKDKGKNKKISKSEIGTPSNFRHVGHVGWDPNTGFDLNNMDPDLKKLFDMCGISEDQLKDRETSKVIYDFIEEKGGVEAVKDELRRQAPPTPKGGPPSPPNRGLGSAPKVEDEDEWED
ncbi:actin nucleation-promoting factor WASL-like [Triplophysa dalaica]|uniref:actin nucleation-promoting factor WASL-like n=1 Tax=Triplophysa dalaica TaxID=1582913 RepID=UPI0024DF368C|nr:actin nucleation-promoting factor WASL-like [Triplophysa dalaica]